MTVFKAQILCEYERYDLGKAIMRMLNNGWRVVNAFYRDGKAYGWCALLVKEESDA